MIRFYEPRGINKHKDSYSFLQIQQESVKKVKGIRFYGPSKNQQNNRKFRFYGSSNNLQKYLIKNSVYRSKKNPKQTKCDSFLWTEQESEQ